MGFDLGCIGVAMATARTSTETELRLVNEGELAPGYLGAIT